MSLKHCDSRRNVCMIDMMAIFMSCTGEVVRHVLLASSECDYVMTIIWRDSEESFNLQLRYFVLCSDMIVMLDQNCVETCIDMIAIFREFLSNKIIVMSFGRFHNVRKDNILFLYWNALILFSKDLSIAMGLSNVAKY